MDNEGIDYLLINRLLQYCTPPFNWDGNIVSIRDIKKGIIQNIKENNEPFPDLSIERNKKYTKEWHVGRVIYFINNPNKITPIAMDNECVGQYIVAKPIIMDGHHRYLASIVAGFKIIPVYYSGRVDLLEYLLGKSNVIPI